MMPYPKYLELESAFAFGITLTFDLAAGVRPNSFK